ncbi:hypothetical protein [Acrocarpospora sp. B8E8]|uniref:hypothetical protein n=1 Tax=Acrocarpospora sp. B8E8 TaxID=3153572 RepID=UPI00325D20A8
MKTTVTDQDKQTVKPDPRAEYIRGLRALADILENNPDLDLPYTGRREYGMLHFIPGESSKKQARLFARLIPGTVGKEPRDTAFDLVGKLHGLHVKMIAQRDEVCTRVVTGTREVTEEIPDPQALAAVPKVTVTRTEEVIRWDCKPILAADDEDSAVSA